MTGDRLLLEDVHPRPGDHSPGREPHPQLDLTLDHQGGQTWLRRQRAAYPFHLGRSWHVAGDPPGMLTFYVQSCSGGIFQGDDLRWRVRAQAGACAHITTAASTIVHRMDAGSAQQTVELHAAPGAVLEYLPDPLILFRGARLTNRLSVHADPGAVALWWDALIPHDPLGQGGHFDWLASETSVYEAGGRLLARDRFRLEGGVLAAALPGVTGSWKCQGAFFAVQQRVRQTDLVDAMRAVLPSGGSAYSGAASLPSGCGAWVRVLAKDAVALRCALNAAWYAARKLLFGVDPLPRRK